MSSITFFVDNSKKIENRRLSIFVSFQYSPIFVNRVKSLRIRYYDPDKRTWEVPCNEFNKLQELFSDEKTELKFSSDETKRVFENEQEKQIYQTCVKKINVDFPKSFEFKTQPFNHQIDGIKHGLTHSYWLLGDEQGLGKSKQIIDLAVMKKICGEIDRCIIICCINSLRYNWAEEIQLHSNESFYIVGTHYNKHGKIVDGSVKERIDSLLLPRKEFFLIINIESLRSSELVTALSKYCKKALVATDEAHKCCNPTALQTKGLLKIKAPNKIPMTGTPLLNSPLDLFVVFKWLEEESGSFFQFKNRYCVFGGFGGREVIGYKNMNELRERVERIQLRRLKKDVLNLPEKIRQFDYLDMGGKQELLYTEVKHLLKDNIQTIMLNPSPLSQLIRLRQVTGAPEILSNTITDSVKMDRMEELIEDLIASDKKVVVFSQWQEMLSVAVKRVLKTIAKKEPTKRYKIGVIHGDVSPTERQKIVNDFQTDTSFKVLFGTTGSLGTGVTLTAAQTAIMLDLPWTEGALAQAEDRLHRIGTAGTVNIICLVCRNTIDEKIIEIVYKKKNTADALIDGQMNKLDMKALVEELLK